MRPKLLSGLTLARISINLRMTPGGAHRAHAKANAGKCAGDVVWFLANPRKKKPLTFHYTGCLLGILIMVYEIIPI